MLPLLPLEPLLRGREDRYLGGSHPQRKKKRFDLVIGCFFIVVWELFIHILIFLFLYFFFLQNGNGGTSDGFSSVSPPSLFTGITSWKNVCQDHDLDDNIQNWCEGLGELSFLVTRIALMFFSKLKPGEEVHINNDILVTLYDAFFRVARANKEQLHSIPDKPDDFTTNVIKMKASKKTGIEREKIYEFCRPILLDVARELSKGESPEESPLSPGDVARELSKGESPEESPLSPRYVARELSKEESPEDSPLLPSDNLGGYLGNGFKNHFLGGLRTTLITNLKLSVRRFQEFVPKAIKKILSESTAIFSIKMTNYKKEKWAKNLTEQVYRRVEEFKSPDEKHETSDTSKTSSTSYDSTKDDSWSKVKDALRPFLEELRDALPKDVDSSVFFWENPEKIGVTRFLPLLKVLQTKLKFDLTPIGSSRFFFFLLLLLLICFDLYFIFSNIVIIYFFWYFHFSLNFIIQGKREDSFFHSIEQPSNTSWRKRKSQRRARRRRR